MRNYNLPDSLENDVYILQQEITKLSCLLSATVNSLDISQRKKICKKYFQSAMSAGLDPADCNDVDVPHSYVVSLLQSLTKPQP